MKSELVEKAYAVAKERYAAIGVDTDKVIAQLEKHLFHCIAGRVDDVVGF